MGIKNYHFFFCFLQCRHSKWWKWFYVNGDFNHFSKEKKILSINPSMLTFFKIIVEKSFCFVYFDIFQVDIHNDLWLLFMIYFNKDLTVFFWFSIVFLSVFGELLQTNLKKNKIGKWISMTIYHLRKSLTTSFFSCFSQIQCDFDIFIKRFFVVFNLIWCHHLM